MEFISSRLEKGKVLTPENVNKILDSWIAELNETVNIIKKEKELKERNLDKEY